MKTMTQGNKAVVLTSAALLVVLSLLLASAVWAWRRYPTPRFTPSLESREIHLRGYTLRANLTNAPHCFTFHRNCIVDAAPHNQYYLTVWITKPARPLSSGKYKTHKILEIPLPSSSAYSSSKID